MTIKITHIKNGQSKPQSDEQEIRAGLQYLSPKADFEKKYEFLPGVSLHYLNWFYLSQGAAKHGITWEQAWHMCAAYYDGNPVSWEESGFTWVEQDEEFNQSLIHMQKLAGVKSRLAA